MNRQLRFGEAPPSPARPRRDDRPGPPSIQERFAAFHRENPEVYRLFAELAAQLWAAGRQRYSADALLHVCRYRMDLTTTGDDGFKINNNFSSRYARLLAEERPEFAGFFETRRIKTE